MSRKEILRKSSEFRRVISQGKRRRTEHFILYINRTNGPPRLGLTVSRKIGKAVVRNSVKRKLREFFRKNKQRAGNADVVVIAGRGSSLLDSFAINKELIKALKINDPKSPEDRQGQSR